MKILHLCLLPLAFGLSALAQGTAFTYQGRLTDNGAPASGLYDLNFRVLDAPTLGNTLGPWNGLLAVPVSNGLFTVALDFGAGVFAGPARWLEIAVRTNNAESYVTLTPRQPLTPSPYAIFAANASNAVAATAFTGAVADSQLSANIPRLNGNQTFTGSNGFSGIVNATHAANRFAGHGAGLTNVNAETLDGLDSTGFWKLGGNTGTTPVSQFLGTTDGRALRLQGSGVGINTPTPDRPLAIQGSGPSAEWLSLKDTNGVTRWHLNSYLGGVNFAQSGVADARLFLGTNGGVGIGSSTPLAKLEIQAGADNTGANDPMALSLAYRFGGYRHWIRSRHNGNGAAGNSLDFYLNTGNTAGASSGPGTNNVLTLTLDAANGGSVGIGTNNPQSKLDVAGTVSAARFSGQGAIWWQTTTALTQAMEANRGYIAAANSNPTVFTLPASPAVGDMVRVAGLGDGGWMLQAPAGLTRSIMTANDLPTNWVDRLVAADSWVRLTCIASSADGSRLVAAGYEYEPPGAGSRIYVSASYGTAWEARGSKARWNAVASSADGSKLVAAQQNGLIYTSSDYGITWSPHGPSNNWHRIASSADGTKLLAAAYGAEQLFTSADSGNSWTARETNRVWVGVASSADGIKLAAVVRAGRIYTSTDSGLSWTPRGSQESWEDIASSADGTKLVVVGPGGKVHTSVDSGLNWTPHTVLGADDVPGDWAKVASSADGTKLIAVESYRQSLIGRIVTSTDSGQTWVSGPVAGQDIRGLAWAVASSADGNKVVLPGENYVSTMQTGVPAVVGCTREGAVELLYLGNGKWRVLSSTGPIGGN